jgi:hypothetical protein
VISKVSYKLRIVAFACAAVIATFQLLGYQIARAINHYYFKVNDVPITPSDILAFALVFFLLFVALTGRLLPNRAKHD